MGQILSIFKLIRNKEIRRHEPESGLKIMCHVSCILDHFFMICNESC